MLKIFPSLPWLPRKSKPDTAPQQHIGSHKPRANCRARVFVLAVLLMVPLTMLVTMPGGLSTARAEAPVIVAFGDSITAGLGVAEKEAWPAVLQQLLATANRPATVINAGVSGDTTAGGKARLAWSIDGSNPKPTSAVVALGGNDALRALAPEEAFRNLDAIISTLKKRHMAVLLAGMLAPPNLGADYGRDFRDIYARLADKHKILLYPFLLEGVAAVPDLNQADGIHPTAEGQKIIAQNLLPYVKALLNGKTSLE